MFGLFGVIFIEIIFTALVVAWEAAKIAAILLHMGAWAIWCSTHAGNARVCKHAWIRKVTGQ